MNSRHTTTHTATYCTGIASMGDQKSKHSIMIRYETKQKCKEYDKYLIKYTLIYKTVLYIKLTWNPQASQILSSIDGSYLA